MMRFVGTLLLSGAAFLIVRSRIRSELSRQSLYTHSAAFWAEFARLLSDTHASPEEILRRLASYPRYQDLDFVTGTIGRLTRGKRFRDAYWEALEHSRAHALDIAPLLEEAGQIPGAFSLEHQLERLGTIVHRLEEIARTRQEHIDASLRLWHSLSIFAALFVFIFFI